MYTREEFEEMRINKAIEMAKDESLKKAAIDVLIKSDHYNWIHQTNWIGEPILQVPQDMFIFQEIIYKTRPEYIIEVGVAWGGSLLFYSTLMEIVGGKKIIGIDIYIPDDLKERINSKGKIADRINWINRSSTDEDTIDEIKTIIGKSRNTFIVLDSNHTHNHVLQELRLYSQFVGKNNYLICGDTIIEEIPEQKHRTRPWGIGNNPKTALIQFLKENDRFEVDKKFENKLLFSCNPGGYLRCIKN